MARLWTSDLDSGNAVTEGITITGTDAFAAAAARSGAFGFRHTVSGSFWTHTFTGALGTAYFMRSYVRLSGNPTVEQRVMQYQSAAAGPSWRISPAGALLVVDAGGSTLVTDITLVANTWYRLELEALVASVPTTSNGTIVARRDGTTVFTGSANNAGTNAYTKTSAGDTAGVGASGVNVDFDDWALNDSTGAADNSFPGAAGLPDLTMAPAHR